MDLKNYRTHQTIKDRVKPTWDQKREDPTKYNKTEESVKVKTVPGQTISVKELIERHKKGRPQPQE